MQVQDNPFTRWLDSVKKVSPTTLYLYWRFYERFKNYPFTQEGIDEFFNRKKNNNSISRAFLKAILEFFEAEDKFKIPAKPTGKKKKRIIKDISQDQVKKLRNTAYYKSQIHGFLFDLVYYGALRRGEIKKIRVNSFKWDVWFQDITQPIELIIEQGKGQKDRTVLIPAEPIKKFLEHYLKIQNIKPHDINEFRKSLNNTTSFVFMQKNNKPLSGWKIWKILIQISEKALGFQVRPHQLRHTRSTELESRGLGIREIQHYLGHSSPDITELYLHTKETESIKKIKANMMKDSLV